MEELALLAAAQLVIVLLVAVDAPEPLCQRAEGASRVVLELPRRDGRIAPEAEELLGELQRCARELAGESPRRLLADEGADALALGQGGALDAQQARGQR